MHGERLYDLYHAQGAVVSRPFDPSLYTYWRKGTLTETMHRWRIFIYAYAGLCLPAILLMTLGAAIGGATDSVPEWAQGFEETLIGGVLAAMLSPAGGFGRFVVVVLAFTLLGNISATMYSVTLNCQLLVPRLARVPRYFFSVAATAIVIPVGIRAAGSFLLSLENFLALIGYWSAAFVAVLVTEHLVFRGRDFEKYEQEAWNDAGRLPVGVAALAAPVLAMGLVVPSMAQVWFTGPIAETTGDIGFEVAFVLTALLYLGLRYAEKRLVGR